MVSSCLLFLSHLKKCPRTKISVEQWECLDWLVQKATPSWRIGRTDSYGAVQGENLLKCLAEIGERYHAEMNLYATSFFFQWGICITSRKKSNITIQSLTKSYESFEKHPVLRTWSNACNISKPLLSIPPSQLISLETMPEHLKTLPTFQTLLIWRQKHRLSSEVCLCSYIP